MNIDWPFTSHMVLQRNQTIHFSGSSNYSHIKVQVDEDIYAATVVLICILNTQEDLFLL